MKVFITLFISLFTILSASAQVHWTQDSCKYVCAYDYIIGEKKTKAVAVSNVTRDFSGSVLQFDEHMDSLKSVPEKKATLESINEGYISVKESSQEELANLSSKVKKPKYVVFFSPIIDNMLIAEILPFNKQSHKIEDVNDYARYNDRLGPFYSEDLFLFIFDDACNIKKVLKYGFIAN